MKSEDSASQRRAGCYAFAGQVSEGALGNLHLAYVVEGRTQGQIVLLRDVSKSLMGWPVPKAELERGLEVAKKLRHPKVLAVLEAVETTSSWMVVNEYADSESLRSVLDQQRARTQTMPPAVATRVAIEILGALREARELWIKTVAVDGETTAWARQVFGGLLPENVLLTADGEVLLTELGLSGLLIRTRGARQVPAALAYRAPEQLAEGSEPPDERADVFCVGIFLWELLSDRPLFGGAGGVAARVKHTRAAPLDMPRNGRPGVSTKLARITAKALEKDPAQRFGSLEEMLQALQALPAESIAEATEVARHVAEVTAASMRARRGVVRSIIGASSSPPPVSGRPTLRPSAGGLRMAIAESSPSREEEVGGAWWDDEAPTVRRPALQTQSRPAVPASVRSAASAPGPEAVPVSASPTASPRLARESDDGTARSLSLDEDPPALKDNPFRKRLSAGWVATAIAGTVVLLVIAGLILQSGFGSKAEGENSVTQQPPSPPALVSASSQPPIQQSPSEVEREAASEAYQEVEEEKAAEPDSSAEAASTTGQSPRPVKPSDKRYYPRGI